MFPSTTARLLPHSALKLRPAETRSSASQLEAHLQAAPVEQCPYNRDIVEQVACQAAAGAHGTIPGDSSQNAGIEAA
jgi:hypothetical protein